MEAYLKHIYRDLRELEDRFEKRKLESPFKHTEHYALCEVFNYDGINLPPAEFLQNNQMRTLVKRLETLLHLCQIYAPVPLHLEDDKKYELFHEAWSRKCVYFNEHGVGRIQFCEGILETCCFKQQNCICGAKFNCDVPKEPRRKAS